MVNFKVTRLNFTEPSRDFDGIPGPRFPGRTFIRTVSFPLPEYSMPTWLYGVVFDEKRIADGPTTDERNVRFFFVIFSSGSRAYLKTIFV